MNLLANKKRRRRALTLATVLGLVLLAGAQFLATWQSTQVAYYNHGVELYQKGDADGALKSFEKSLAAYRQERSNRNWLMRKLLPEPSKEIAALALSHEGVLWLVKQKPEMAVAAWKQSLKLNPGDGYQGLSSADENRLREEALVVKYNLELLFKKNPSMAQQEGQGQGQGKPGQGQPKPNPGNDPGRQAGKGNKDDI